MDLNWKILNPKNIDGHVKSSMIRKYIENITFKIRSLHKIQPVD